MWQPVGETPKYNIMPLFVGTLKVTLVALLFAVPLSVLGALFVSEFAGKRWREIVKPAIELLAGIPSVVIGFFARQPRSINGCRSRLGDLFTCHGQ